MPDLTSKIAVITGASSGIGAATAEHFSALGALVVLSGRDECRLQQVQQRCVRAGAAEPSTLIVAGDVCSEQFCQTLVDKTIEKHGRIDILVNCAGSIIPGPLETLSLEDYDKQMLLNARAVVCMMKLATPHLLATRGNVVNVSSINGIRSFAGVFSYCVSKSAVDQMTRCAALELAARGVRVNAVNPGVVVTGIHKSGGMSEEQYAKFLEHSKTTHAMGRVGEPMEVAKPIAFLASDDASFITGVTLPVDGGRGAMCPR